MPNVCTMRRNRMTVNNLAIVFGPNMMWSRDAAAGFADMGKINGFSQWLFSSMGAIGL